MVEGSVEIIKLLSVALTREKQNIIKTEFDKYASATNYVIKAIYKRSISNTSRIIELLQDEITEKILYQSVETAERPDRTFDEMLTDFGMQFSSDVVSEVITDPVIKPTQARHAFAVKYRDQFVRDVVKTARVEIGRHRELEKTIRKMRDKIPHFKQGKMMVSGVLVNLDEKGLNLLTSSGKVLPLPFDKRSRNREVERLGKIKDMKKGKRKYGRIRFTWNKEGYVNIDIRLEL
ncbi:MAG: hypothetical protein ACTSUO_00390 [Candidatus Thorarchaeota archaeon]